MIYKHLPTLLGRGRQIVEPNILNETPDVTHIPLELFGSHKSFYVYVIVTKNSNSNDDYYYQLNETGGFIFQNLYHARYYTPDVSNFKDISVDPSRP